MGRVDQYQPRKASRLKHPRPLRKLPLSDLESGLSKHPENDVMVLYTSTHHKTFHRCKRWEITFSTAAYDLQRNAKLKFIHVTLEQNYSNHHGVPNIMFYPGKKSSRSPKQRIQYDRKVTVEDIIDFLRQYGTHPVAVPKRDFAW